MEFKDKLKALRIKHGMTQDECAEKLGVSAQTVSKWERGIFAPDITLLPKIAVMYQCSIDSLFNMQSCWNEDHEKEFNEKAERLRESGKFEELYKLYLEEIERTPDKFTLYHKIMWLVHDRNMSDDPHVSRMLLLIKYAEKYCGDKNLINEITILIMMICFHAQNPRYRAMATSFYEKLPEIRHCREVYSEFAFDGDKLRRTLEYNISYFLHVAHKNCNILSGTCKDAEEKLGLHKKAASIAEIMTCEAYDEELIENYRDILFDLAALGKKEELSEYMERLFLLLERRISGIEKIKIPDFVSQQTAKCFLADNENKYVRIVSDISESGLFTEFKDKLTETAERYEEQIKKYLTN